MKRRIVNVILVLSFLLILVGCSGGSYIVVKGDIETGNNSLEGEYSKFTGKYYKKVQFEKDDVVKFNITTNTVKGELSFKLLNPNGDMAMELQDGKLVNIKENGTYKVQVEGNGHEGSFKISWSKN